MVDEKLIVPIVASAMVFLLLGIGFIIFLWYFSRSKRLSRIEQQAKDLAYERLIAETEQEVQKHTLQEVGKELHDNIGQLLTVARIQIGSLRKEKDSAYLEEVEGTILNAAKETRHLAHSLNSINPAEFHLLKAIQKDISRLERIQGLEVRLDLPEKDTILGFNEQIIAYRIFQERLNNSLKHAAPTKIEVSFALDEGNAQLMVKDNGKGFYIEQQEGSGDGLKNMRERAELIGAVLKIESKPGIGCKTILLIPRGTNQ